MGTWRLAGLSKLTHDPEKWVPVFPRDKREAFARRSCSKNLYPRLIGVMLSGFDGLPDGA